MPTCLLTAGWKVTAGRPENIFRLRKKGLAFFKELEATWNELANAVHKLANKTESMPDSTNQNPTF